MNTTIEKPKSKKISFHFHPFEIEKKSHAVEKEENGKKRRYLKGISSGLKTDGDGERMTAKAIQGFMDQANSGDILLFAGKHDVDFTNDIGILSEAKILPDGDWFTLYRLYDKFDNVGAVKLEKSETLWRQINGIAPYKKPIQKGFSIEGRIPEAEGIKLIDEMGGRVIDKIELDGVVVVNRPSYFDGIVNAVYKALELDHPKKVQKEISSFLSSKIQSEEKKLSFLDKKFKLLDALESQIEKIMSEKDIDKINQLEILFDEFKRLMIGLLTEFSESFNDTENTLIQMEIEEKPEKNNTKKNVKKEQKKASKSLPKYRESKKIMLMKDLSNKIKALEKLRGKNNGFKSRRKNTVSRY